MIFFELKAAIQSRIWDIMHENEWKELDDFSIILSEKLARKMITGSLNINIMEPLKHVRTNFFTINNVTKKDFARNLAGELEYLHQLFKPIVKRKNRRQSKNNYKTIQRRSFSDDVQLEVLRNQDHKCGTCGRILNVVDYDHIDGDRSNNDISNCQALCPYCHAIKSRKRQT